VIRHLTRSADVSLFGAKPVRLPARAANVGAPSVSVTRPEVCLNNQARHGAKPRKQTNIETSEGLSMVVALANGAHAGNGRIRLELLAITKPLGKVII
jgi:hypothetical protein